MANPLVVNKYSFIRDGFSNFQLVQLPVERKNTFDLTHSKSIYLVKKPHVIMAIIIDNDKDDESLIFMGEHMALTSTLTQITHRALLTSCFG